MKVFDQDSRYSVLFSGVGGRVFHDSLQVKMKKPFGKCANWLFVKGDNEGPVSQVGMIKIRNRM